MTVSVVTKITRNISSFNTGTRLWKPIDTSPSPSLKTAMMQRPRRLSLISWNIDAFSARPTSRAQLILDHVFSRAPDIIFLQEVRPEIRRYLLNDAQVRANFLITDAEDESAFSSVPFATIVLLSGALIHTTGGDGPFGLGPVTRVLLPSKYKRDALCVDLTLPTSPSSSISLINVHLDSLGDTLQYRAQQLKIAADLLRSPGCSGGIIAGDFNAISPADHELISKNELVDAWIARYGACSIKGATWGMGSQRRDGLGPKRLDKIATLGLTVENIQILQPGRIEIPRSDQRSMKIPWSDHHGLSCTFTIK